MSLNGLDDPTVIEAYQAALVEAGGWFLLKYVARDVVDLLARGTGGVAEIRITIDGCEEKSPLYGFLQYRRRKIILKYVPEGTSRLIQARITVQFQSILDRFSPYDTVFSLALSSELTEHALSSACLLHTASRSMTSSTSSLRRCRLGEIMEDAEENTGEKGDYKAHNYNWRDSIYSRTSEATAVPAQRDADAASVGPSTSQFSTDMPDRTTDKPLPSVPRDHGAYRTNGLSHKPSVDQISYAGTEPRTSTQSSRPSIRDLDQRSIHRPKVKLGPRPSLDNNGRPRTAGSLGGRTQDSRPVASLPAGVRYSSRKMPVPRPKSQTDLQLDAFPQPPKVPPVPSLLVPPPPINLGPMSRNGPSSPRSVMSMPAAMGMSPEKARLMRALQLRNQQMEKRAEDAEKKRREMATSKDQEKGTPAAGDKRKMPVRTGSAEETHNNIVTTQKTQQSSHPVAEAAEDQTTKPAESEERAAVKSDSAVAMADSDMASNRVAEESERRNDPETQGSVVAAETESPASPASHSTQDINPDCQQASQLALDKSQGENAPQQIALEAPVETPNDVQGQLKITEIETNGDLLDSATPTPRAVPIEPQESEALESQAAPVNISETASTCQTETVQADVEPVRPSEMPQSTNENAPADTPADASAVDRLTTDAKQAVCVADVDTKAESPSGDSDANIDLNRTTSIKDRRQGVPRPIQIPANNPEFSDEDNLLSDDSFMEELKSASVQEAKPITLPKSGMTDGNGSPEGLWPGSRAVSNPTAAGSDLQALPSGRSASATYFENQKPVPVLVARKVNVSSGISKRIKALEMFSSREPNNTIPQPAPPSSTSRSSSPFEKFRKRASISQTHSPPAATLNKAEAEGTSRASKRQESLPINSPNRAKSGSVSVTARIVRDPSAASEQQSGLCEPVALNLQRSELTVEQTGQVENQQVPTTSIPKIESRRPSVSSNAQSTRTHNTSHVPRSDSITNRLSISSLSRFERSLSHSSGEQVVEDGKEDKKESRKSRIMRRMSSITSNSRRGLKSAMSSTVKEEAAPTIVPPSESKVGQSVSELPQAIDIGEANVQFPHTLLWKRRFLRVDSQGYLVLTPSTVDGTARNIVKRYHFSDFRMPCLPDQDRQELPNSIVLDFFDGGTLQCACESRQSQHAVLQILVDAHHTYHNSRS